MWTSLALKRDFNFFSLPPTHQKQKLIVAKIRANTLLYFELQKFAVARVSISDWLRTISSVDVSRSSLSRAAVFRRYSKWNYVFQWRQISCWCLMMESSWVVLLKCDFPWPFRWSTAIYYKVFTHDFTCLFFINCWFDLNENVRKGFVIFLQSERVLWL